ncbi:MAG: TfoX/Sxy family protein [Clostridia bacterium]|nr:TfoX/Sxy family protein [Clostridia bacterium]
MASNREYLEFVMDQLSPLGDVSFKPMMGEFIIYCQGKVVGGIYDDRFLVKPTKSAMELLPDAPLETPYEGAKEMILVEDLDDRDLMCTLVASMVNELPEPKKKK